MKYDKVKVVSNHLFTSCRRLLKSPFQTGRDTVTDSSFFSYKTCFVLISFWKSATIMSLCILANRFLFHAYIPNTKIAWAEVTSVVNKWQTESTPVLPVTYTLSNFLPVLSIMAAFQASDGKCAKFVELCWHYMSHLRASRWGTRWPTYHAPNKSQHAVTWLTVILLPLVLCVTSGRSGCMLSGEYFTSFESLFLFRCGPCHV